MYKKIQGGLSLNNTIIVYLACICFLFIFGKVFILPIKTIVKLILNSVLGGVLIFVINLIGNMFEFHIGLNYITIVFVGILGVPGAILLMALKLFLG